MEGRTVVSTYVCPICLVGKSDVISRGAYGDMCGECFLDLQDIAEAMSAMEGEGA